MDSRRHTRAMITLLCLCGLDAHGAPPQERLPSASPPPDHPSEPVDSISTESLQEVVAAYEILAAAEGAVDWQDLLRPIPQMLESEQWAVALAAVESIQEQHNLSPTLSGCERWSAWQLARCKLELAAGRYADAVSRHVDLLRRGSGCVDDQSLWWSLTSNHATFLRDSHQYSNLVVFAETVLPTFPSAPARAMRAEIARLRYRLGTLQWHSKIHGVLGDAELGGIASHYREFVSAGGGTLKFLVDSSVVVTRDGKVWDRDAGFVAADEEAQPRRPAGFHPSPLVPGTPATIYLDDSGNAVMIELSVCR